jgi:hypothetical protein
MHDLFGSGFVLLTGARGSRWSEAADRLAREEQQPIASYRICQDCEVVNSDGRWPEVYGITDEGAVLVRPDGVVCWRMRSAASDPPAALLDVMRRLGVGG